ncbi:MAG: trypsin-like serine peptidase [Paracoccaceae bacterium]
MRLLASILGLAVLAPFLLGPRGADALDLQRRRMLTAAEHEPWRAVGRVNVAARSERGMCTGTLIASDLVITAAHCLYSERTGQVQAPGNIHFVAGWRRGTKVAHRRAQAIAIHPDYRHGVTLTLDAIATDLALIRLAEPIPDAVVEPFRLAPADTDETLTLVSYRRDRAHALTRQDGCEADDVDRAVVTLACDITFGASGSPVFATAAGGEPRVVAVISAKGKDRRTRRPLAFAVRPDAALPKLLAAFD